MSLPASRTRCARDWPPANRTLLEGWANAKTYRTGSACRNAFGCPGCQWPGVFRRPSSWPDGTDGKEPGPGGRAEQWLSAAQESDEERIDAVRELVVRQVASPLDLVVLDAPERVTQPAHRLPGELLVQRSEGQ